MAHAWSASLPYIVNRDPNVVRSVGVKHSLQLMSLFLSEVGKQGLPHTVRDQLG